jgi:hypothetical protein
MSTLREAAQQALDALYDIDATGVPVGHIDLVIDTLKAALAQQEQKQECWLCRWRSPRHRAGLQGAKHMTEKSEALRLADALADYTGCTLAQMDQAAAELRRLHAENERLINFCYDYTFQITALRAAEQMRTRIDAMKERKKNHE